MNQVSIAQALKAGWASSKRDWRVWLLVSVIFTITSAPQAIIDSKNIQEFSVQAIVAMVIGGLVTFLFVPGISQNSLLAVRSGTPTVRTLAPQLKMVGKFFIYYLLYMIIVALGFVALIIPGIYLAVRYSMAPYIMLDNPATSPTEAMRQSSIMTKGRILQLIGAISAVSIVGGTLSIIVALLLGLLISSGSSPAHFIIYNTLLIIPSAFILPLSIVGTASIYEQIKAKPAAVKTATPVAAAN